MSLLLIPTLYSISSIVCLPFKYGNSRKKSLVVFGSLFSTIVAMYSFSRREARAGSTIRLSAYVLDAASAAGPACVEVVRENVEWRE